jgi:CYTH domain-containing protein
MRRCGREALVEIDQAIATALGFPKLKYAWVERERRWLCRDIPRQLIRESMEITDLYVTGTSLRLREALSLDGGPPMRRLTRKADVDSATRLLTSIYLAEAEFALLSGLPGRVLRKTRHRLQAPNGLTMSIDSFRGALDGLILAECEFDTAEALAAFPTPAFAVREVTDDPRYRGGTLVRDGLPREG